MSTSRVSITAVVPTFDRPALLERAVRSILSQISPADEIIVVDNGVEPVPDDLLPSTVRLLRIAPRAGVSAARNAGATAASSEYVSFLDDDDWWQYDYLHHVRAIVAQQDQRPDIVIGRKDREVDGIVAPYKEITSLVRLRDILMVKNPGVGGQNLTARKGFFSLSGGFRPELHGPEDRAFLVDALDHGADVRLAPQAVAVKVIHPGEQITDGRHSLQSTWRYLRIYWGSMDRVQRRKNLRRLRRAVVGSARQRSPGRLLAQQ